MNIHTGTFYDWREHHSKWFNVFRFGQPVKIIEIWVGNRYLVVSRGKNI